ncbi:ABC transporter permease [Thiolapillus brandeum]|uniref:ABC transporter permease n=1 Tax=Thiolapillus brandeum TaxID=1076588 RepID=A0A7U6GHP1_9GAMM|nr:ABC transporter permease [Thiolapillus brandeum]
MIQSFGQWRAETLGSLPRDLEKRLTRLQGKKLLWDFSRVAAMDSSGMVLLMHYLDSLRGQGCEVELSGLREDQQKLQAMIDGYAPPPEVGKKHGESRLFSLLVTTGEAVVGAWRDLVSFLAFLGEDFLVFLQLLWRPWRMRWGAIVKNIQEAGVRALPIITLTSFLIGVVIAYQGAVQLQKFGANIFVVDMIAISVTRELAPLITAIVVAGRTGSSYTAQIGVMKITQEIDAMRIMGFEPHRFLVLPRVIAVMIALPLMIFFADIIGIIGGMVVANIHLNISWAEFIHRLQNVLDVKHVWIGIAKGPFFAWLIAMVGCFRGFQVSRNTESIGRYTTISVVNAIFLVIACDALFSVVFTRLGI